MAEQNGDAAGLRSRYEAGESEEARRHGGLLISTGLQPSTFQTLKGIGLGEGYREMIVKSWRKFIQGNEQLPSDGGEEYEALGEFLYNPDVLRQLVILQNKNLSGTTFIKSVEQIQNDILENLKQKGTGEKPVRDVGLLIKELRTTFDVRDEGNQKLRNQLGLTKDDIERLTATPEVRREYITEISYGVKSRPADLLASHEALETFSFLSSPLAVQYVTDSLKAVGDVIAAAVREDKLRLYGRERNLALNGFLPMLTVTGAINDQYRVRLRNALWTLCSYGICSVRLRKNEGSGALSVEPVTVPEKGLELFASALTSMLEGPEGGDSGMGNSQLSAAKIQEVIDLKWQTGELNDADARTIDRFRRNAANPLYLAITRLKRGGRRPSIKTLITAKGLETEQKAETEAVVAEQESRWVALSAQKFLNDDVAFAEQLRELGSDGEREHIRSRLQSFRKLSGYLKPQREAARSALQAVLEKVLEVLNVPVDIRISEGDASAHLAKLRGALRDLSDLLQRYRVELQGVESEYNKQRGIRYDKKRKAWSEPNKPASSFTRFLEVFRRGVMELMQTSEIKELESKIRPLEQSVHFYHEVLPAARRGVSKARAAIKKFGQGKESGVTAVEGVITEIEDALGKQEIDRVKQLRLRLDSNLQLIVPAEELRKGRKPNLERRSAGLKGVLNAVVPGAIDLRLRNALGPKLPQGLSETEGEAKRQAFQLAVNTFMASIGKISKMDDQTLGLVAQAFDMTSGKAIRDVSLSEINDPEKRAVFVESLKSGMTRIISALINK